MAIDNLSAAKAYLNTARTIAQAPQGDPEAAVGAPAFGQLVGQAAKTVDASARTAETAMTQAAMGRADLVDVVTAVAAAEATLQTVVAVRDQVIKAYQDILKMPI